MMLLTTVFLTVFAAIFTIIGVATDSWPDSTGGLFVRGKTDRNYTAAGVLLILAILMLVPASVLVTGFFLRLINTTADRLKALILFLIFVAGIFIVTAYSRTIHNRWYSYHITVTAGALTFISTIFLTYWIGRTSVRSSN